MDYLWTPWRYQYLAGEKPRRPGVPAELEGWSGDEHCVFCNLHASVEWAAAGGMAREDAERAGLIVARGEHVFVCLNRFPYSSGHLMVVPYAHLGSLAAIEPGAAHEIMDWAQRAEAVFQSVYKPDGVNFGLNLGEAAGAGVAGHLHLHGLPRWNGDSNFMTVIAETRILPESLETTWERLRDAFSRI